MTNREQNRPQSPVPVSLLRLQPTCCLQKATSHGWFWYGNYNSMTKCKSGVRIFLVWFVCSCGYWCSLWAWWKFKSGVYSIYRRNTANSMDVFHLTRNKEIRSRWLDDIISCDPLILSKRDRFQLLKHLLQSPYIFTLLYG